jgi:hypothetical protein
VRCKLHCELGIVASVAAGPTLHSRKRDHEVQLFAFDIMAFDGDDLRRLALSMRKTSLARLLARRPDGIFIAPSNRARSVLIYFGRLVSSGWRGWCRSGAIGRIRLVGRSIGSR